MTDRSTYLEAMRSKRDSLKARIRWVKSLQSQINDFSLLPGVAVTKTDWRDVHINAEKHSKVKVTFRFDTKEPVDELLAGPWDDVSLTKPETETRYKLDVEANTA